MGFNVGVLIIRVYYIYTITIIRNPPNPILVITAPIFRLIWFKVQGLRV